MPSRYSPTVASAEETPESLKLSQRVISLPMHPYLSEEDQETIVTALQAVLT